MRLGSVLAAAVSAVVAGLPTATTYADATAPSSSAAASSIGALTLDGTRTTLGTVAPGPTLSPGPWQADLPSDGSKRVFTVRASQFPTIAASVITNEQPDGTGFFATSEHRLQVTITAGDSTCDDQQTAYSDGAIRPIRVTAGFDTEQTARTSYLPDACKAAQTWTITVTHTASNGKATPARIALFSEPKITGSEGPAATDQSVVPLNPPEQTPTGQVTPGTGFADATTVTPGSRSMSVKVGSPSVFRVRMEWGQRLAVRVDTPALGSNYAPPISTGVSLALLTPDLYSVGGTGDISDSATMSQNSAENQKVGAFTAPVLWSNRTNENLPGSFDQTAIRYTATAGWFYIYLQTGPSDTQTPPGTAMPTIPMRLTVQVTGATTSAPHYVTSSGAAITLPGPGQLSVGQGITTHSTPWARIALTALTVAVALALMAWVWRRVDRR